MKICVCSHSSLSRNPNAEGIIHGQPKCSRLSLRPSIVSRYEGSGAIFIPRMTRQRWYARPMRGPLLLRRFCLQRPFPRRADAVASPFRAAGKEMSPTVVDPNFRQLSTVSTLRSRDTGAGENALPASSTDTFGSNEGRQSEIALSEDRAANARQTAVEAGFGQLVRPRPFPPIGPVGQLPKPQLPDWWPTLEDVLRIYPMVRYGRVRRGNDDEDCVERHSKEVDRWAIRLGSCLSCVAATSCPTYSSKSCHLSW